MVEAGMKVRVRLQAACRPTELSFVLDPANHQRDSIVREGELHTY